MDISSNFDNPIFLELLQAVQRVADELNIQFFLVGATARDILLQYGHGIEPGRATSDIDFGFNVASWDAYDELKAALIETGDFEAIGEKQRVRFKSSIAVDVLPFGEIVDNKGKITWRPDGDTELNLLGFEDAYENSLLVRLSAEPLVEIRIASAAGLVLLKLFAWDDRKPIKKDAIDLGILIRSYMKVGNGLRINEEHHDLQEHENFDYDLAGAHLLGRDLARICQEEIRLKILDILNRELDRTGDLPLVIHSSVSSAPAFRTLEFWEAIRHELRTAQGSSADPKEE